MILFRKHIILFLLGVLPLWGVFVQAQPVNDDCANAEIIAISGGGWDLGTFTSSIHDLGTATLEVSEFVHPSQVAQDKSMWFSFDIPTTRNARVILKQTGPPFTMASTDAGWTLYRNGTCLPGAIEAIDPPIINIEGYTHECLKEGSYLIQVTGKFTAVGDVFVELQLSSSTAPETSYDYAQNPYNFGVVSGTSFIPASLNHYYEIGCQSIFDLEVPCPDPTYTKSTWHQFTTDGYVDYIRFEITETPWNTSLPGPRIWGYNLYEGNSMLDSIPDNGPGLTTEDACKTLSINGNNQYAATFYPCQLLPNTTYSIQLFHPTEYSGRINVRMYEVGSVPTISPDPNSIPPSFQLGPLAFATQYNTTDYFSCNALMSSYTCAGMVQDTVWNGSTPYDMNIWLTFEVTQDANVDMDLFELSCQRNPRIRVFQGDVMASGCPLNLDTTFTSGLYYRCMPAGKYSVQILGDMNPESAHNCNTNLAKGVTFRVEVDQVAPMAFGLVNPGEVDSVNTFVPLDSFITYDAVDDYFGCQITPMPQGDHCNANNMRAMYRVLYIDKDGIITVGGGNWSRFNYRFYQGDASSLPIVSNEIIGLVDMVGCQSLYYPFKVCVTPGYYTLVSFGDPNDVSFGDSPWFKFEDFPPTQFTDPLFPETLDTLGVVNASISATPSRFNCEDNPLDILGYTPCGTSTKQIYREFYLDSPQLVTFNSQITYYSIGTGSITYRIFNGRLSLGSLTGLYRNCGSNFTECMEAGWYTVVAYAEGETTVDPFYTSGLGDNLGDQSWFSLSTNPNQQQYGSFGTAEQVNGGTPIYWEADIPGGHTPAYPMNHVSYTLGTEYWDCADNLPFPAGIDPCLPAHNRVSYRVFTLSKPSLCFIEGLNPSPYGHQSRIYLGDITSIIPPFTIIQECISDDIRLCLDPGTYTLVTFAGDGDIGRTLTPTIYLDSLGTSNFDHAQNAYDFGDIPNDATEYYGNILDLPGPNGEAPSSDFFFCTTGAQVSDPSNVCPIGSPPPPSPLPSSWDPRRNLWYTFTVTGPGTVEAAIYNKTIGKPTRSPFAIYKGPNVAIPPVDSTIADGLELVAKSTSWWCGNAQKISFYRDPCSFSGTDRYYIIVDKHANGAGSGEPNTQIEVGMTFTPAPPSFVSYDHYSQANVIVDNPTLQCIEPYVADTLYSGTYTGCVGNLNCATEDVTDQNTCGTHTIWYTFEVSGSGAIRINYDRPDGNSYYNANDIQLYKEVVPGDSSNGGLVRVNLSTINVNNNPDYEPGTYHSWGEGCMEPGRYFILFTGCNYPTETVIPRIWLLPQPGDLCSDPINITVDTAGTYSGSAMINCFTIGEAPGEDGSNMGCLDGPVGLKSAWFFIEVNDTNKMDFDIDLDEFTNVPGDQIRYRIATGDCNYMTFDNCVQDGGFIILNLKCRPPEGSFWIQVTMPDYADDSIRINVTATPVPDSACVSPDPDRPRADFDFFSTCNADPVQFYNNSTSGDDVSYYWDFGDGFSSTIPSPSHYFAVPDTYLVSLVVDNTLMQDTLIRQVITYPTPEPNFNIVGSQPLFVGDSISLANTSLVTIPTATYYWDFCSGLGSCGASMTSYVGPNPPNIAYSVSGLKEICLTIANGTCDSTTCFEVMYYDTTIFAGGSYDGTDYAVIGTQCEQSEMNIYAGSSYDGSVLGFLSGGCSTFDLNIFGGGVYDGSVSGFLEGGCPQSSSNIYAGGPFDGHTMAFLTDSCSAQAFNVYTGGAYDGFAFAELLNNCPQLELNIYAGGHYDGFDLAELQCDTIPLDTNQSSFCDTCFYAGGSFDGAAVGVLWANCDSGELEIYAGGPFDGSSDGFLGGGCSVGSENIFAGGPLDGAIEGFLPGGCNNQNVNIYSGGPLDGAEHDELIGNCSDFLINVYAGGAYDGHSFDQLVPDSPGIFTSSGDTICSGLTAELNASAPANWFIYDGFSFVYQGGPTTTFVTPVLNSPGVYEFFVDNPFHCEKQLVQVYVLEPFGTVDFYVTQGCAEDSTFFTNQSMIPGPSIASIGGFDQEIQSLGQIGLPPGPGQISFSSSQSLNYNNLSNGFNDQQNGWTAGNAGPSTEWVQWNYLSPWSVNRITYWPRNNCCPDKGPTELRLFYDQGSGWIQVKSFYPAYPSNADFDSGVFFETANIYAKRWKLEADVLVANAPSWGEFQVHASQPVIGGSADWAFGDGNGSTLFSPTHIYASTGSYDVVLSMELSGMLCENSLTQSIDITCGVLAAFDGVLGGYFSEEDYQNVLLWNPEGDFSEGVLQKMADGSWNDLVNIENKGLSQYELIDFEIVEYFSNRYRVKSFLPNGETHYSQILDILVQPKSGSEIIIFPNPAQNGEANLMFHLDEKSPIKVIISDVMGKRVYEKGSKELEVGKHIMKMDISDLATATYFVSIIINNKVEVKKLVVINK